MAPTLFSARRGDEYALFCGSCGTYACEHCNNVAIIGVDDDGPSVCIGCDPAQWNASKRFVVQFHFAFTDRNGAEQSVFLLSPWTFDSRVLAFDESAKYLNTAVRAKVSPEILAALGASTRHAVAMRRADIEASKASVETVSVPAVTHSGATARVTLVCAPVDHYC